MRLNDPNFRNMNITNIKEPKIEINEKIINKGSNYNIKVANKKNSMIFCSKFCKNKKNENNKQVKIVGLSYKDKNTKIDSTKNNFCQNDTIPNKSKSSKKSCNKINKINILNTYNINSYKKISYIVKQNYLLFKIPNYLVML